MKQEKSLKKLKGDLLDKMAECSFCGSVIKKGSGKVYVRDNGYVLNFCSMKCEKNMLRLKRDARKFKWTSFFVKNK